MEELTEVLEITKSLLKYLGDLQKKYPPSDKKKAGAKSRGCFSFVHERVPMIQGPKGPAIVTTHIFYCPRT